MHFPACKLCVLSSVATVLLACKGHDPPPPTKEHERIAYIREQIPLVPPRVPKGGCPFNAGDLPEVTLDPTAPLGSKIPIDHFIFVVQENRSFDHYFQDFTPASGTMVDVAPSQYVAINPKNKREPVRPFAMTHPCPDDPPHDYESVLLSWHGGKMDGFALAADAKVVSYFSHEVLDYYHALARAFTLSDRHFADFLGPTWPNRLFMLSGTSFGHISNTAPPADDIKLSIFRQLEAKKLRWRVYADSPVFEASMYPTLFRDYRQNFKSLADFREDALRGNLPELAWVESSYGGPNATDEHPPANIEIGQQFVSRIIDQTMRGPSWVKSLLILTYDEHGGFYDHVAPPPACVPDDRNPRIRPGHLAPRFDHLGIRVPLVLVSPWVRRGYVTHTSTSHASLLRLVQTRFALPALTRRDANAAVPFDAFDFEAPARLEIPELPVPRIEANLRKNCEAAAKRVAPEHQVLSSGS